MQKLDEWKEEIESCKLLFYSGNMRVWNEVHTFVTFVFALFENYPKKVILRLHITDSRSLHLLPAFLILNNYCRYMHLMTQGYLWQEMMSAGARCPTVFDNHDLESFKGGYQISVILSNVGLIYKWMHGINNGIKKPTGGYQNFNTSQMLISGGQDKVRILAYPSYYLGQHHCEPYWYLGDFT